MNVTYKTGLEGLAGRSLTAEEVTAIDGHLVVRNDVAIAAILSVGKRKLKSTIVGVGTIMEAMGKGNGGPFLDTLTSIGQTNRDVFWAMELIKNSNLDIGAQDTQATMTEMASAMPAYAAGLNRLKVMGTVEDIVDFNKVSDLLNNLGRN